MTTQTDGTARVPARAAELSSIAQAINAEHAAAHAEARSALERARRCGELLLLAKSELPHGAWLSWIDANLSFGARQAQKYVRLFESWDRLANATSDSLLESTIDLALARVARPLPVHVEPVSIKPVRVVIANETRTLRAPYFVRESAGEGGTETQGGIESAPIKQGAAHFVARADDHLRAMEGKPTKPRPGVIDVDAREVDLEFMQRLEQELRATQELREMLKATPAEKALNAWIPIVEAMRLLHKRIGAANQLPPCPKTTRADLTSMWPAVSSFFAATLEEERQHAGAGEAGRVQLPEACDEVRRLFGASKPLDRRVQRNARQEPQYQWAAPDRVNEADADGIRALTWLCTLRADDLTNARLVVERLAEQVDRLRGELPALGSRRVLQ